MTRGRLSPLFVIGFLLLTGVGSTFASRLGPPFADSPFGPLAAKAEASFSRHEDRTRGNSIIILDNGFDALLLRVHLIRNARRSIDLQTFIWVNDECGRLMMYELIEAAKRGVKVRIIVDSFGAEEDPGLVAFLATVHPNLKIAHYRPVADRVQASALSKAAEMVFFLRDSNQRMHNKIMTFDDVIGITGGRNIQNAYFNFGTEFNFKDRDVAVIGPATRTMSASFERFWVYRHSVPSRELKDVARAIRSGSYDARRDRDDFRFNGLFVELSHDADESRVIRERFLAHLIEADKVEFVADRPGKKKTGFFGLGGKAELTERMFALADVVRKDLIIQSPYLVLDERGKEAFRKIRRRGVKTTISSNSFGAADHLVTYAANYRMRSFYVEELGFVIYEYKPYPTDLLKVIPRYAELERRARLDAGGDSEVRGPLVCIHAKSFVLDDRLAYIGSYNLDPRSGNLNTEVGLMIEDAKVATALKESILRDTLPGNSWVIAKRKGPLTEVNALLASVSSRSPLDLWPIKNTTSFELIPGFLPVSPGDRRFYDYYRDIGSFPGVEGISEEEIITRIFSAIGKAATPLL